MLILGLAGNTGVAAYGVVANTSLVAVALFNGIAQGSQPLISESYSKGNHKNVTTCLKMAVTTTIGVAVLLVVCIYLTPLRSPLYLTEREIRCLPPTQKTV